MRNFIAKENGFYLVQEAQALHKSHFFPYQGRAKASFKNVVILGLGSNLGPSKKIFEKVFWRFKRDKRFHILKSSSILQNKAFGFREQNDFLNSVLILQSSLNARQILKIINNLEKNFARIRLFKNSPRTLDIDILYFSRKVRKSESLEIPHSGAKERISVILPLGELI